MKKYTQSHSSADVNWKTQYMLRVRKPTRLPLLAMSSPEEIENVRASQKYACIGLTVACVIAMLIIAILAGVAIASVGAGW